MPTDRKSLIDAESATFSSPDIPRSYGLENDSRRQRSTPPLGVPLTGNLLFMITWIASFGIAKAVYSYHGQSVISPTLDWVGGTLLTLISLWLGVIENKRPDLCPWFFEVDLAPPILRFLCRYTLLIWFASIPPVFLSVTMMVDGGRLRKYEPAQKDKNRFVEILGGILVFVTISLCFLCGSRVFWKRGYDRIAYHASCIILAMVLFGSMYTAACVYAFHDSKYTEDKVTMAINSLLGTFPLLSQLYPDPMLRYHQFLFVISNVGIAYVSF